MQSSPHRDATRLDPAADLPTGEAASALGYGPLTASPDGRWLLARQWGPSNCGTYGGARHARYRQASRDAAFSPDGHLFAVLGRPTAPPPGRVDVPAPCGG
ncbi:hypothetical protein [Streptomyces bullii]|uniref:Uncharacterized protein n=1 Tax=Streptomyces bullii TaxID=349910 RepID=A0ABW0UK10_9ACTN